LLFPKFVPNELQHIKHTMARMDIKKTSFKNKPDFKNRLMPYMHSLQATTC
jgi:hypothetical protein